MRWIIALSVLASPAAFAEDDAQLIAFTEGRYSDAILLAEASPTADSLAFTARSILAEAVSASDHMPQFEQLIAAEAKARRALELDARHVEARLQLAISLSLQARPLSNRAAMRTGYGEEAKRLVDGALQDDPQNVYAHGFLAVWHLEVRRRGGPIGASIMGASVKKARQHYQAAIETSPDDASVHWQYARALTALNAKRYRHEVEPILNRALACHAGSRLEDVMIDRAETLRTAIRHGDWAAAEHMAAQML